jgi:hypothetical protein
LKTPLEDLTKKGDFFLDKGGPRDTRENEVGDEFMPCFILPDFTQPFVLECDSSGIGIGVLLMQSGHPIAFESRKHQ